MALDSGMRRRVFGGAALAAGVAMLTVTAGRASAIGGRYRGPPQNQTMIAPYIPQTLFTAIPAQMPTTRSEGGPTTAATPPAGPDGAAGGPPGPGPGQPPGPGAGQVPGPGAGANPRGPMPNPEPMLPDECTAQWLNYWEVHKDRLLAEHGFTPARAPAPYLPAWDDLALQTLLRAVFDGDAEVAGHALLGLGLTGRPESFALLADTLRRMPATVPEASRLMTILGIGLSGDPRAGHLLRRIVELKGQIPGPDEPLMGAPPGPPGPQPGRGLNPAEGHPGGPPIGEPGIPPGPERPGSDAEQADEDDRRAAVAALALGLAGGPEHIEMMRALLMDRTASTRVRTSVAFALQRFPTPDIARACHDIGFAPHFPHVLRGVAALVMATTSGDTVSAATTRPMRPTEILLVWLSDLLRDSRTGRLGAVAGILRCAKPEDAEGIRDAIARETDLTAKGLLCLALGRTARAASADVRTGVLRTLRHQASPEKPESLRAFAAFALGTTGVPAAVDDLRTILRDDSRPGVRSAAAMALALLRDGESRAAVTDLLATQVAAGDTIWGAATAEALALLGGDDAAKMLKQLFTKADDPHLRRGAGYALALMGERAVVPGLLADLSHENDWRSWGAVQALVRLHAVDQIPALARIALALDTRGGAGAAPAPGAGPGPGAHDHGDHAGDRGRELALLTLGYLRRPAHMPTPGMLVADAFAFTDSSDLLVAMMLDVP